MAQSSRWRHGVAEGSTAVGLAQFLYDRAIGWIVWTVLVPFTAFQILRGRATRRDLRERLAVTTPLPKSMRIVVHAVSAGEATSAGAFVRVLAEERPEWSVVATCGNQDARAVWLSLQRQLSTIEMVVSLPWDRAAAMRRWLRAVNPSAVVVVEPEIWPNLYRGCGALGVPLFLVNGRLDPRDVGRYGMAKWFFAAVLRVPAWIGVQSEGERDRFVAIGASAERIEVAGSLKFDTATKGDPPAVWKACEPTSSRRVILVAGSTYRREEDWLLRAVEHLRPRFPTLRLVLAPRHVTRAGRLVARARARGHRVMKASAMGTSPWDVLVLDRMGELPGWYGLADLAFVGGTLVPRGGHNVLEPARVSRAIIVGPHVDHIRDFVDGLAAVGGIVRLAHASPDVLTEAVCRLLDNETARQELGARARDYCTHHGGAARRSVEAMTRRMPISAPARSAYATRNSRGERPGHSAPMQQR